MHESIKLKQGYKMSDTEIQALFTSIENIRLSIQTMNEQYLEFAVRSQSSINSLGFRVDTLEKCISEQNENKSNIGKLNMRIENLEKCTPEVEKQVDRWTDKAYKVLSLFIAPLATAVIVIVIQHVLAGK